MVGLAETIENNKLIAEFMEINTSIPHDRQHIYLYDISWDWLMPVVEKIESLPLINDAGICVLIEHSYCRIYLDNWGEYTTVAENATKKNKLSAVYLSVIEFIKWYNQNKEL